jgi:PAS domain S-box-containing protein
MDKNNEISILYVEDQDDVRLFLSKILSRHYSNIFLAVNGKDGLEKYNEHKPDIIISDIKMPVMDGLSMSSRIKAIDPKAMIILTTAHSDMEYFIQSIEIGINQYILKPIDRDKLFAAIETCKDQVMLEREVKMQNLRIKKSNEMLTIQERELRESLQKAIALKEMISKSEENFREVAENIQDAFWLRDTKKIIFVNKAFEFLFELPTAHLFNNPEIFIEFIHQDDKEEFMSKFKLHEQKGSGSFGAEFRIVTPSGKLKNIWYRDVFIKSENINEHRRLSTLSDISWKIENEKLQRDLLIAERAAQIKQRLLANVSHEMRTPLNGVLAMTQILASTPLSAEQQELLETIKNSGEEMLEITTNLIDISELENSTVAINENYINTHEFFEPILNYYSNAAQAKGLTFYYHFDESFPARFYSDSKRIHQVLKHFVENALKFTQTGGIEVLFFGEQIDQHQWKLSFRVIDSGIGIKDEYLDKIFQLFTQQDDTDSRKFEGLGLGLTICKSIASLMKGSIDVNSEIGKGSTFSFTFPSSQKVILNDRKSAMIAAPRLNLTVLCVEDKEVNQKIISIMLKNAGCKVDIASNGLIALEMFEKKKYDLILMDIQMPVMDGITATRELRKKHKKLPPIIGVSANAIRADAQHYINKGLDDYISKPVIPAVLYAKIQQWINSEKQPLNTSPGHQDKISIAAIISDYPLLPDLDQETLQTLKEQTQYDDQIINDLYLTFLQEADVLLLHIGSSFQKKDYNLLKDSTHALKGLSATIGAMKVYHIASEMDKLHKQKVFGESESLFDLLLMDFNKVKSIINTSIIKTS